MITGVKSLQKFHNTVCPDWKPIRTVDDNSGAEVRWLCSSCRSVPSPAGIWAIRTSKCASSTSPATPGCRVLTLYFSFSLVLILSFDLLHNFYSNSGIGPVPAMVEADTTRPSHTYLDWDFEPRNERPIGATKYSATFAAIVTTVSSISYLGFPTFSPPGNQMTKNTSSADSMKGFLLLASKGPQRTMGQERTYAIGFNVTKG